MKNIKNYSMKILSCALIFIAIFFCSPVCAVETIVEPAAYPDKPQDVVKAFIEAGLKSTMPANEMRLCDEILEPQHKYFPDKTDENSNRKTRVLDLSEPWGRCLNKYHIVKGYEINEVKVLDRKAAIKVTYKRLGWIWFTPKYLKKCKDLDNKINDMSVDKLAPMNSEKKKDEDECKFLYFTKDTSTVLYNLAKPGRFWRITDCCEPHVSVESAIKILECEITEMPGISKQYPSEKQKAAIRTNIEDLKNMSK